MTGGILEQILAELQAIRTELADLRGERAKYITVAEYAAARSISVSAVRAAIRSGRLPKVHSGRAVRVPADVEIAAVEKAATAIERAERKLGLVQGGR